MRFTWQRNSSSRADIVSAREDEVNPRLLITTHQIEQDGKSWMIWTVAIWRPGMGVFETRLVSGDYDDVMTHVFNFLHANVSEGKGDMVGFVGYGAHGAPQP